MELCDKEQPPDWKCTRERGHSGPCALTFDEESGMVADFGTCFVFGSNLAGRHGAGAARTAMLQWGAEYGVGIGRTGDAYAIPTKDANINTLSLHFILHYVNEFKEYAKKHPLMAFYVTPIGCGLAGYKREQIRPMFYGSPRNCVFAHTWFEYD